MWCGSATGHYLFRCDEALQQNEVANIFEDDFAFLGDDDSGTGNRKENSIAEYQSFTDLQHSKGKAVSAIHWLPHRKASTYLATPTRQSQRNIDMMQQLA